MTGSDRRQVGPGTALRQRHHNLALHTRNAPAEPSARACYDAVEQVRYEALGANAYAGMRGTVEVEDVAEMTQSHTGYFLKPLLARDRS